MNKVSNWLLLFLLLLQTAQIFSQTFGQDAEGNSTIFTPSKNFQLDLANNVANFTYYDCFKAKAKTCKLRDTIGIFGLELKGKEQEGIVSLFSGENLNTDVSIKFLLGTRKYKENTTVVEKIEKVKEEYFNQGKKLLTQIKTFNQALELLVSNGQINKDVSNSFKRKIDNDSIAQLETEWQVLKKLHPDTLKKQNIDVNAIDDFMENIDEDFKNQLKNEENLFNEMNTLKNEINPSYRQFFFRGGMNGTSFKLDLANGLGSIKERFADKNFYGLNLELGYNLQKNYNNFWGFSYRYDYTNNLNQLTSTEFNLTTTDSTITNGQFSTSKKVKAFLGDFQDFGKHSLNVDYLRAISIRDDNGAPSNFYLTINPYIRYQITEKTEDESNKNNLIIGLGINAFNSKEQKVMGGLFVQFDSVLSKRFRVGLLARFNFSGTNLESPKTK